MFRRSKSQERDKSFAEALSQDLNNERLRHKSFHKSTSDLQESINNEDIIEHPYKDDSVPGLNPQLDNEYDTFLAKLKQDKSSCKLIKTPLGRILLNHTAYIVEIARKNNTPLPKNFYNDTIDDYNIFLDELEESNKASIVNKESLQASINEAVQNSVVQQHAEIFDTQHKTFLLPPFPTEFGSSPVLTDQKLTLVNNTFPVRQKFAGKETPSISEFLRNIKSAQLQCQLNEEQFKTVFLRCFTGQPYEIVCNFIDGNLSINEIISSLLTKYDKRMKPDEANSLLNTYKPPHNATYDLVVSEIINLAQRACSNQPEQIKNAIYNYSAIECLLKNLPTENKGDGEKTRQILVSLYGRAPTFDEFTRALRKLATAIDVNYKKYSKYNNNRTSLQVTKPLTHIKSIRPTKNFIRSGNAILEGSAFRNFRINEISYQNRNNNRQNYSSQYNRNQSNYNSSPHKYHANGHTSKPSFANKPKYQNPNLIPINQSNRQGQSYASNRKYYNNSEPSSNSRPYFNNNQNPRPSCGLCGKTGHKSTGFCYEMRTDSGNFALVKAVPDHCPRCKSSLKLELYHPDSFCPMRPRALFLKANKMWPPPTEEIKEQMKKQQANFHK